MRIVYYGFGGGHGHAMRGLAILGRLRLLVGDHQLTLLAPARLAPWAQLVQLELRSPPWPRPRAAELGIWLRETLAALAPDLVLVDVFPRGVLGELAPLDVPAWLITRWVQPRYYLEPSVRAALESRYQRLVWCEEPPVSLRNLALPQQQVPPVLIEAADACLPRAKARRALGFTATQQVVFALGSGELARQHQLCQLLGASCARKGAQLYFISDGLPPRQARGVIVGSLFPAMHYLRAADLVVCAGGYHAFHETRALGLPALYIPQARRYDDQFQRVAGYPCPRTPAELEQALSAEPSPLPPAEPRDGAAELAQQVLCR